MNRLTQLERRVVDQRIANDDEVKRVGTRRVTGGLNLVCERAGAKSGEE